MLWELSDGSSSWSEGISTHHRVIWYLDLSMQDFLEAKNKADVRVGLAMHHRKLRRDLFELFMNHILPDIFEDLGEEYQTEGEIKYKSKLKINNKQSTTNPTRDQLIRIRNVIHMRLHMRTNIPVTSVQAAYASRASIASLMSANILSVLDKKYLGIQRTFSSSDWSISADQIDQYDSYEEGGSMNQN